LVNFVNNKANGDIVLDALEFCYFLNIFSQVSVVTHCRCGGKYDMNFVANLQLSITVKKFIKEFIKLVNISRSYEQISSGTFYGSQCIIHRFTVTQRLWESCLHTLLLSHSSIISIIY